ncbi:MAG: M20/M25/M40 family metallo-hydrolase [Bacteroidota bacterium]
MMINSNQAKIIIAFTLLAIHTGLYAQTLRQVVNPPVVNDYAPIQMFLASDGLEGRETGTIGSCIAADYIASMMQKMNLSPYLASDKGQNTKLTDYFQDFNLLRFSPTDASVFINPGGKKNSQPIQLSLYKDFSVKNTFQSVSLQPATLFAGYGINLPELGYNDYADKNVKGKMIIVIDGYPGQHDTLSAAWRKFRSSAQKGDYNLGHKCREAENQGAVAIMVIKSNYLKLINDTTATPTADNPDDSDYPDAEYFIPADLPKLSIPCFQLTETGSRRLSEALNLNFGSIEQFYAQHLSYKPFTLKALFLMSIHLAIDTLQVYNVVGTLTGRDTTQTVIVGAHYDHLGKRGNNIYYGSDDNASGVAGMLALAETWTDSKLIPPCNIAFASWTAEEKGLIGSEYFVKTLAVPEKVKLYINLDMISRSVAEDTAHRQLSIGTRKPDEYIREIARKSNSTLSRPFELDLWDVTGHSGSDYASFTAKNIPVITCNTGLHNDYHTPRDIPANADLIKMGDVLKLVNGCLWAFLGGK